MSQPIEIKPGDVLLIYYHRRRAKHLLRHERTKTELGEFDQYRDAKLGASAYPGTKVFHASPGGNRQLSWQTHCATCGQELPEPHIQ